MCICPTHVFFNFMLEFHGYKHTYCCNMDGKEIMAILSILYPAKQMSFRSKYNFSWEYTLTCPRFVLNNTIPKELQHEVE